MAGQLPPEEIFRFAVVRNPRPLDAKHLTSVAIKTVVPGDEQTHPEYKGLLKLIAGGADRVKIRAYAARRVAAPTFMSHLEKLITPVLDLADRLAALDRPLAQDVRDTITASFGVAAVSPVSLPSLSKDRVTIADSLILASVVDPLVPGLRSRLVQGLRAVELVNLLAAAGAQVDDQIVRRLLRATVLLPRSIFPLPTDSTEADSNEAERKLREKAGADRKGKAQKAVDRMAINAKVIDELTSKLSRHLFTDLTGDNGGPKVRAAASVIPRSSLSPATQAVLSNDLRLNVDRVDVAHAVTLLEKRNLLLGQEVANFDDLVVQGDLTSFAVCGECAPDPRPAQGAANDFEPATRGAVEVVGVQDLLIVRQRLAEYRAGEIAHIENVLKGEMKAKRHRKLDRTETTFFSETEREANVEEELQTTDKYELQSASSRTIQEDKKAEAGVTVTASYGPVEVEAHGSFANSTSTSESRQSASTYARDVVSRSVHSIRERVLSRRSRNDITELEVINEHELNNRKGTGRVVGVYRWVDKFYEAQVVNYGQRTMLEFMVPDPAAFYRYAQVAPSRSMANERPERPGFCRNGKFQPLRPTDLRPENYLCFVARYNVADVAPPQPRFVRVSDLLKFKVDTTDENPITFAEVNDSFKVPVGYAPRDVTYRIAGGNSHSGVTNGDEHDDIIHAMVTIGSKTVFSYYKNEIGKTPGGTDTWPDLLQVIEWGKPLSAVEQQFGSYAVGDLAGSLPADPSVADDQAIKVSLVGHTTLPMSVAIHYTVLCERTQQAFERWQLDTFAAIQQAYLALLREYETSLEEDLPRALIAIEGRNPAFNREIERRELKKFAITLLTGQQYDSFNAMERHYLTGIPQINLEDASAEGRFVRFFEQALEWKHMTYLFYPYFWAAKSGWVSALHQTDVDSLFAQFLQAGFARVWVPIRPGFDLVVLNYLQAGGEPWSEKDAPLLEEPAGGPPPLLSLINEIKESLGADFEFRPGTIQVTKGSTNVVGTGTDFIEDDTDREILVALTYHRISKVDVANQTVTLSAKYEGDNAPALRFGIGVKFVGPPWLVQVPTTLVHLAQDDSMIVG